MGRPLASISWFSISKNFSNRFLEDPSVSYCNSDQDSRGMDTLRVQPKLTTRF